MKEDLRRNQDLGLARKAFRNHPGGTWNGRECLEDDMVIPQNQFRAGRQENLSGYYSQSVLRKLEERIVNGLVTVKSITF